MNSLSTVLYALRRSGVDSRDNITVTYIEPIHLKELKGLQIKKRDTGKIIMFLWHETDGNVWKCEVFYYVFGVSKLLLIRNSCKEQTSHYIETVENTKFLFVFTKKTLMFSMNIIIIYK